MGGPPPMPAGVVEGGQTYCLRWNNHKSNLIEILDALIKVESYVDCTIVVDDQIQFKAHRVVLAANSPYFQAILQDVPMDHCSIIFPGVKAFEMRALLEYMYTGEVNVTQSQIPRIMRIAEELEVKGLFDMTDLKEKFNKMGAESNLSSPYSHLVPNAQSTPAPYASASTTPTLGAGASTLPLSQESVLEEHVANGGKKQTEMSPQTQNSSAVISSTHISPTVTASSSSGSPTYSSYKSPAFPNMQVPIPEAPTTPHSSAANAAGIPTHSSGSTALSSERAPGQWPLSPNSAATAAAMLSSVYESAPDMNPLKRKKLSSISSMLMNRDTPILRNVLAQANPADSSQALPLLLPGTPGAGTSNGNLSSAGGSSASRSDKNTADKTSNNSNFNGTDFGTDKKYTEEPHSPFTDRSYEEDGYDHKGNFTTNFSASNSSQKPEWKRYKQYTRNDIMSAIQCVRDGMSALQASRKFGVPSRTLYDKVKKLGITTGRPMNRSMKRSPSSMEASAAFPYAHGYGQSEVLLSSMHEARNGGEERETKEHQRVVASMEHGHIPPTIPHPAAALLDHAFLQQALENRGGDIAGREALHAMALAAAAHAAANRISSSPGPNGNQSARASSPSFLKYTAVRSGEHDPMTLLERENERRAMENERDYDMEHEHERDADVDADADADDEDDQVEDLSVQRCKESKSPVPRAVSPYSPTSTHPLKTHTSTETSGHGVIMSTNTLTAINCASSSGGDNNNDFIHDTDMKRELVIDEGRAD